MIAHLRVLLLWVVLLGTAARISPASAHVFFERAEPRVGSVIEAPPPMITIWFDGQIEPAFSTVVVTDAAERRVDREDARVGADDPMRLAVSLPPLPPGIYTVVWRVVALDGHPTEGRFTFTVKTKAARGRQQP